MWRFLLCWSGRQRVQTSTKVWLAQPNSSDPSGATGSLADGQTSCPYFIPQAWGLTHQVAFIDLGIGLGQPLMCVPRQQASQCFWPSHITILPVLNLSTLPIGWFWATQSYAF